MEKKYLGSDNYKRTAREHVEYLKGCAQRWHEMKQPDMEKMLIQKAKEFYEEHREEIEG